MIEILKIVNNIIFIKFAAKKLISLQSSRKINVKRKRRVEDKLNIKRKRIKEEEAETNRCCNEIERAETKAEQFIC